MVVQEASREARSTIREWTRYGGTNQILYLALGHSPRDHSLVRIRGKCNKLRRCALWPQIVGELPELTTRRSSADHVFLNRFGEPITRFGIHTTVERYVRRTLPVMPSLAGKRVSPHTIRHTTATHLVRAGVDINTIRACSLNTTNIYAEVDLEMKAKALATCEVRGRSPQTHWKNDVTLMQFLRNLQPDYAALGDSPNVPLIASALPHNCRSGVTGSMAPEAAAVHRE